MRKSFPMSKNSKETDRLIKIVESFPKITVTVLGDMVADEFIFGEISRVSREAPVLILKHRERTIVPGGGANAANNLADLGVNVLPVGILGDDEPGRLLLKYFRHKRIAISGVLKDKSYTTVTKTRILAGMKHTSRQQVVRVDREPERPPNSHLTRELILAAREYVRASDALLVSDYGYGAATPAIVNVLRQKARMGTVPLVLDSRHRLFEYSGVTAAFTAALAAGATTEEAAQLANYAGGIVVMKRGTATVSRQELVNALEQTPPSTRCH